MKVRQIEEEMHRMSCNNYNDITCDMKKMLNCIEIVLNMASMRKETLIKFNIYEIVIELYIYNLYYQLFEKNDLIDVIMYKLNKVGYTKGFKEYLLKKEDIMCFYRTYVKNGENTRHVVNLSNFKKYVNEKLNEITDNNEINIYFEDKLTCDYVMDIIKWSRNKVFEELHDNVFKIVFDSGRYKFRMDEIKVNIMNLDDLYLEMIDSYCDIPSLHHDMVC